MHDLLLSAFIMLLLMASAAVGHFGLARLPERHRTRETLDFTRLTTGLLVTFTALVLSLLISAINTSFEHAQTDVRTFASDLIRLDEALTDGGATMRPSRALLRQYTASAIASTWSEEIAPTGRYPSAINRPGEFESANLTRILQQIGADLRSESAAGSLQAEASKRLGALIDTRWRLIGEVHSSITLPFFHMMVFWLIVVFVSFGMSAPRNGLAALYVVLVGLSVAGAIFVILELDGPLDGMVRVSSAPMRHALRHMDESAADLAPVPN